MDWPPTALERLARERTWGYHAGDSIASEPAALAAIALVSHADAQAAAAPLEWLLGMQGQDGSVGIEPGQSSPGWPTGLAVLAWHAAQGSSNQNERYAQAIDRGLAWMLSVEGQSIDRGDWKGHDTTIRGWPWVLGTHSWLEPTAINLIALKQVGRGDHPRAEEARRMLHDRLLPDGGCNYGNTIVFGQELRPHVQPTGVCLLALSGRDELTPRIERSLDFLRQEVDRPCGTASLSYALMALAAWQRDAPTAAERLAEAARRVLARDASSYKLALLVLAATGAGGPFMRDRAASAVHAVSSGDARP
jgi:hypothetical protein